MKTFCVMLAALVCAVLPAGCECYKDKPRTDTSAPETQTAVPDGEKITEMGTVRVLGNGADLYDVLDQTGKHKINFTSTGQSLILPAGTYLVVLNGVRKEVTIKPDEPIDLQCGTLKVTGIGQDLFEVYGRESTHKLNFKFTNGIVELFEGSYVVKLNNSAQEISIRAGQETTVKAGSVKVLGEGQGLYYVYDQEGKNKLGFTGVGQAMELLPGSYSILCGKQKQPVTVRPDDQTTVTIDRNP